MMLNHITYKTKRIYSRIKVYLEQGGKVLVAFLILVLINGCEPKEQIYRVGIIYDTGGSDWEAKVNAITLAFDQANEKQIHNNSRKVIFEYVALDSGNDAEQAMDMARDLVYNKRINAIIGPNTTRAALPVSLVAQNTKTLMITDGSTHIGTTKGKSFVFRLVPTNEQMVSAVIDHIEFSAIEGNISIYYDKSNIYSRNVALLIEAASHERGFEVEHFKYTQNNKRFEEKLTRISEISRMVILPNFSGDLKEQLEIISDNQLGLKVFILDSWDYRLQKTLIDGLHVSVTGTTHPLELSGNEIAKDFIERYKQKYKRIPDKSSAVSFDAAMAIIHAVKNSPELEAESIRKTLSKLQFEGTTGKIEFDLEGDLDRKVLLFEVSKENIERITGKNG